MTPKLSRIAEIACALVLMALLSGAAGAAPDGTGPAVDVTSKYMTQSSDYVLTGKIRGYTGLKSLTVSLNGNQAQAIPLAAVFKVSVKLKPGQNEILLKTVDKAGHSATNMVVVTLEGSTQAGALEINPTALAAWHKRYENQMRAMRKELAKEPQPVMTQSAAESVKALNDSAAQLRKTLASLDAATAPTPEPEGGSLVATKKKSPPEKRVDNTAPLIEITSPIDAISTNYLLTGLATDDTGVSRLTVSLNKNKAMPIKLKHGKFQKSLVLKHGSNVVRITVADASGHTTIQRMHVVVSNPTSNDLIDTAVKSGKLDRNHALLYKVFAAFGNSRLPSRYKGDDSRTEDDHVLDQAASRFWSLPRKMQRAIVPYFIPPYYIGSQLGVASRSSYTGVRSGAKTAVEYPVIESSLAITPAVYRVSGMRQRSPASSYSLIAMRPQVPGGNSDDVPIEGRGTGAPPCVIEFPLVQNCVRSFKWHYLDGKHVRIWYADYKSKYDKKNIYNIKDWAPLTIPPEEQAKKMLNAVEGPKGAWNKLTTLMKRTPISDKDHHLNGGNGKLDIALNPGKIDDVPTHIGLTITYLNPRGDGPKPVFIVLQRDMKFATIKSDVAHELMHAIQWTYHTQGGRIDNNYSWLMESTAVWAQDYVFPKDNWEHFLAANFIKNPQIPLDKAGNDHEYWSYLFFFYLRWHFKKPELIRYVWEATEHESSGIKAVVSALGKVNKTLFDVFPIFTVLNTNVPPVNKYSQWDSMDGLEDRKKNIHDYAAYDPLFHPLGNEGDVAAPFMKEKPLKHLSARDFELLFPEDKSASDKVRSVAVYNGYSYKLSIRKRPDEGLKGPVPVETLPVDTWALDALPNAEKRGRRVESTLMLHNRWLHSAKTGKAYATLGPGIMFCHDPSDVNDALVLIPSNSRQKGAGNKLKPTGKSPLVWESDIGCGPWRGEIFAHDDGDGQSGAHWKFDTKFTTGDYVQQVSPMFTDKQLQDADSSGAPLPATAFGFAASSAGSEPKRVGMWPLGSHFLQYFGAVMSFGTGHTTWTVHGGCGSQGSGQYKVLVVLITYNFVPQGEMRRQMTLVVAPESYLTHPLNTDRAGLPYQQEDNSGHCHSAHRSEMNVQPIFGSFKPDDGAHASGDIRGADYLNGKEGCQSFDIELETGRKSPKPQAPKC